MINIDMLKEKLKQGNCEVTFTKIDGSKRVLNCTLSDKTIPQSAYGKGTRIKSDNVTSVWCTDINEWRSFRNDSIISWKTLKEKKNG